MTPRTLAVLSLFGIGVAACAQTPRTQAGTVAPSAALPSIVQYTRFDGLIVVKSTIGSETVTDGVIATALPVSLITPELAAKLSIQGSGIFDLATLGGSAQVQSCRPQQITLGRVPISNVALGIFDLYAHLSSRPVQGSPPLWLGWTSLGALSFTIDPEKHEITVNPPAAPPVDKALYVPFQVVDGRIYIQAKLNGHRPLRMLVDTTSSGTLIPADAARALKLTELASMPITTSGGKESRVTVVNVNELSLSNDMKIKDLRAVYVSSGDSPDLGPDTGLLGTDALLRHRVTFHYGRSTIAFEKIEPKKEADKPAAKPADAAPQAAPPDKPDAPAPKVP